MQCYQDGLAPEKWNYFGGVFRLLRYDTTASALMGWTPPDGICVPKWWCRPFT
jgi:hypothetical protein